MTISSKSRLSRSLVLNCAIVLVCCANAWAAEGPVGAVVSKPLLAAIKQISPSATIVQANQVDTKGCAPVPKSPGLVLADFNGDGLEDAAVLLSTSVSKEVEIWQGQELRKADFLFVIFLNNGKGSYGAHTLDRFAGHIPVDAFIDIESSGRIRPMGAKKDMALSNPAIILTFCEKSAAAYVVTGTRIREIPLSD